MSFPGRHIQVKPYLASSYSAVHVTNRDASPPHAYRSSHEAALPTEPLARDSRRHARGELRGLPSNCSRPASRKSRRATPTGRARSRARLYMAMAGSLRARTSSKISASPRAARCAAAPQSNALATRSRGTSSRVSRDARDCGRSRDSISKTKECSNNNIVPNRT
eukprot:7391480-Prymnesium_polylepis.2